VRHDLGALRGGAVCADDVAGASRPPDRSRNVWLVFDEGPGVGLGHRRRMEALGAELTGRGHDCVLVALDPTSTASVTADVVVVDSYRLRADAAPFAPAPVVGAVDDLGRDLAVDVVVDPSPGAIGAAHRRARRVLAGAAYALVPDPEPDTIEAVVGEPVERVLVTMGAADANGVGAAIADTLAACGLTAGAGPVEIRLVVGPWGASAVPSGVLRVWAPDGLARELAGASIVVTAGGVSLLESCRLGRPIVALALADNQRQAVDGLAAEGAVIVATPQTVVDAVRSLVDDRHHRLALSAAARSAIDGKGAARIADTLEQLASR
jgi:spore coat polysaccharide biosynthesis predicted glycosyltransferase SpsG